jgi:ribonuclease P protein component
MNGQSGASKSHIGGPDGRPADATVARTEHAPFARLKKRSEFLAVAKGARHHESAFTLQALAHESHQTPSQEPACRIGLTVTKKTGNSVERNRIRRRLREALRLSGLAGGMARGEIATGKARDYVVVARRETLTRDFDLLQADLARAFERIERRFAPRSSKKAPA